MSNDLNQCQFIGRLGKDCDVRYTTEGKAVTSFSLAVGSQWKSKSGEKQESTEWVNCTAFDKLGEICAEYLKKGSQVFISGKMKTEKYTDKSGIEKYATKIIVNEMQMLGSKQDQRADSTELATPKAAPPVETYDGGLRKPSRAFDNFDDDISF